MGPTAAPSMPAPTTDVNQALTNVQQYQQGMQSSSAIQSANEQALGVGAAQQQVSGLRQAITNTTNLLNQVAPSVYGRTQDSLVTQAQAGRQISNEQAPISSELKGQTSAETNAESDYNNLEKQATDKTNQTVSDQQAQLNNLDAIYKDLYAQKTAQDAAAADAQKQQIQQQQFNQDLAVKQQTANAALVKAQSSANKVSPAQQQQADTAGAAQYLQGLQGNDGHVSQQTWNTALSKWQAAGYSTQDFVKQFQNFVNPKYGGYTGFNGFVKG
jgi:hypothetical protein